MSALSNWESTPTSTLHKARAGAVPRRISVAASRNRIRRGAAMAPTPTNGQGGSSAFVGVVSSAALVVETTMDRLGDVRWDGLVPEASEDRVGLVELVE